MATDPADQVNAEPAEAGAGGVQTSAGEAGGRKVMFTAKVRRGLGLVREVLDAVKDLDARPPHWLWNLHWSRDEKSDYQAAVAWIEQEQEKPRERGRGER